MTRAPAGAAAPRSGLARNVFHLGIGQVLTTALTMMLNAAIARSLGASDFGLLYLLQSITNFAYVFVDWGHGPYITREVAKHPERSGELLGSVLVVRVLTTVVVGAIAVLLTWLFGYDLRTRLLTALIILCWMPVYLGLTYAWIFRGRERMDCEALLSVILKSSTLALALACFALGGRLLGLMSVYSVAGVITAAAAIWIYHRLALPPLKVQRTTGIELIRDGAPLLAISLAVAIQPYIDANVLYKLAPSDVVGWYGAAWVIAGTLVAPAAILGATMYPRLARASSDTGEFARSLRTVFRPLLLVALLGAVGTILFADVAIAVVYGERHFGPAASVLRAFAPGLALIYIDMVFGYAILARGKATQLAKAKIVAVLVTTGVELVLVPLFQGRFGNGGIGLVLATAAGELVMVMAAVYLLKGIVTGGMALDLVRGLGCAATTIFVFRAAPALPAVIGIPVSVLLFVGIAMAFGLVRRQDLELLGSSVRRQPPPAG